jgi:hypothetical protein
MTTDWETVAGLILVIIVLAFVSMAFAGALVLF